MQALGCLFLMMGYPLRNAALFRAWGIDEASGQVTL
jgi:hypothetical protein